MNDRGWVRRFVFNEQRGPLELLFNEQRGPLDFDVISWLNYTAVWEVAPIDMLPEDETVPPWLPMEAPLNIDPECYKGGWCRNGCDWCRPATS